MKPYTLKSAAVAIGFLMSVTLTAQWNTIPVSTKSNLNSVALADQTAGWIVGDKGTILYREDNSWLSYPEVTNANLKSVCLLNAEEGWAVGSLGTILHLKDGQWEMVESPTLQTLNAVSFTDGDNGYAVGDNGTFLLYRSGKWEQIELNSRWHFYTVAVRDDNPLIAGGAEYLSVPIVSVSLSGKADIKSISDPAYFNIQSLSAPDRDNIWAVGTAGIIKQYSGSGWKTVVIPQKVPTLTSVTFSGPDNGITVGYSGTIMTYASGIWQKETSPVKVRLNGSAISGNTYVAVGNHGTVIEFKRITEEAQSVTQVEQLKLSPYPNPASGSFAIVIPESVTERSVLTIRSSSGQAVYSRKLESDKGGSTEEVNIQGLGNGIYLVNIYTAGQMTASGKFIVKH